MSAGCEYYEALISRMLDGELTPDEERELRAHLRTCESCRTLFAAMTAAGAALHEDMAEPPAALADGVMERIYAYEAGQTRAAAHAQKRAVRLWPGFLAAACLLLVIGGGAMAALRGRVHDSASGAVMESVTMGAAAADMPMEAPAAMAAPMPETYGGGVSADEEDVAEEQLEAEGAAADTADGGALNGAAASAARSRALYTIDAPAAVPEGREDDFEALLHTARFTDGGDEAEWHAVVAVEYRGVIYEFLTDDGGERLLWRDAAEGLPALSPGTADDLWDIIG